MTQDAICDLPEGRRKVRAGLVLNLRVGCDGPATGTVCVLLVISLKINAFKYNYEL